MIYILTAICNEKLFVLQEHHTREELRYLRSTSQFFCPSCKALVILKIGISKIPHFAHIHHASCAAGSEPETVLHLLGKSRLYAFFHQQNLTPSLEQYLPQIKQRPDLLTEGQAFEFQCSALPAEQVRKRSAGYRSMNLEPFWIRGTDQLPLAGLKTFQIRSFEQEMFRSAENKPYLLSFNPHQSLFIYFSNLIYLQGNRWIGKVSLLEAERQVYPFAVPKLLNRSEYQWMAEVFRTEKNKFIRSQLFAKNRMRNPFWRLSYELQVDKQALPEILGVPLLGGHLINEHPLIWQMKAALMINSGNPAERLLEKSLIKYSVHQYEHVLQILATYETVYKQGRQMIGKEVEDICYRTIAKTWEN